MVAMTQSNFNRVIEKINDLSKRIDQLEGPQKILPKTVVQPKQPEIHQRTGKYSSDDVSLDKVFYFGKK